MHRDHVNNKLLTILFVVAIIEGILITGLMIKPKGVVVAIQRVPGRNPSPLFWALEYEAPDKKFDELVKKNPDWATYRDPATGWTALIDCVARKRTNCVKTLLANGASFDDALKEAKKRN